MNRRLKILTKGLDKKKARLRRVRIAAITVLSVFIVLVAASFGVGEYLLQFALKRQDDFSTNLDPSAGNAETEDDRIVASNRESFREATNAWLEEVESESVAIESQDGLSLKGTLYHAQAESHNYAILIHGYRSVSSSNNDLAYVYCDKMNFNCLLPDMRACGESEGEYIGMGYLDSKDILGWIDLIDERDPSANILITGVSMGGATTMMTSGLELPASVKCFVEDCGYTSVWDIFEHELDFLFGLPPFPFLYTANALSSLQAGYGFKEANSLEALSRSTLPMLFIHGDKDTFVPFEMLDTLYAAKTEGRKEKLVVKGAGHAESYLRDPVTYFTTVYEFIDESFDIVLSE